jgi:phosphatidylglycerophosphate synthase
VLDCVDGEIARAKVLESEWGEWLDVTSDTFIHVATFLGIAVHAWPELGGETAKWLGGVFAFGGFASFVVVTRAEKTEQRWQGSGSWQARVLATLLATLTTRDSSVLVLLVAASGLQAPFLVAAAVGAQLFWIGALALHTSVMRRAS